MNVRSLLQRIFNPSAVKAAEGEYRPGPWYLPITGGYLPADVGSNWNWWQMGFDPVSLSSRSAMVEACVGAYSQTIAMCPGDHWRLNSKKGRDRVRSSALSRILRYPNAYQSISDFMLNLVRGLYLEGNAYALALRNDRFEVDELHLMDPRMSRPVLAENGEVFYQLAGNMVIDQKVEGQLMVPQRDVLHVRLHSVRRTFPWPILGETPLTAALADMAVSGAMTEQQLNFYLNQARPSAVLSTDLVLDKDQVQALRDRWNEQVKGLGAGGTPILTAGLKVQPWGMPPKDALLAESMKMSEERVALVFRIPLQILGLGSHTYSSTEALMQAWIATGLGFALNHVEEAFGVLFQLAGQPDEYVEFSTDALLRSATKDRIEALARGVQGGIYSPNEARESEGLDAVKDGDQPRVQQQVVPLSFAGQMPPAPPAPPAPPSAAPAAASKEEPKPKEPQPPSAAKDYSHDIQREVRNLLASADRWGRRLT
jgi:HK97 family phage portal protein